MDEKVFEAMFLRMIGNRDNRFHPLLWINGEPEIGSMVYIGGMSEINAKGARVVIGDYCDIASFVSINVADSHLRCLGLSVCNDCRDIVIKDHVFIGSHCAILGGTYIGGHSVIGAGTVLRGERVPDFSLAVGNPAVVKKGYYRERLDSGLRFRDKWNPKLQTPE